VINDRLQKNFFDFVNGYRLKEVQTRLLAPEAEKLTIPLSHLIPASARSSRWSYPGLVDIPILG
jgi:hypothetical protein